MFERNGNDASVVEAQVVGHVVYFKHDYGFIRPEGKKYDDIFFHVKDVEPWREGYKHVVGRQKEQVINKEDGTKTIIPFFPGEKVRFDVKESGKTLDTPSGPKKGFKAINIELLVEFEGQKIIEGRTDDGGK